MNPLPLFLFTGVAVLWVAIPFQRRPWPRLALGVVLITLQAYFASSFLGLVYIQYRSMEGQVYFLKKSQLAMEAGDNASVLEAIRLAQKLDSGKAYYDRIFDAASSIPDYKKQSR